MVKEVKIKGKKLYLCEKCELGYSDKETAEKCEKWCSTYKSCSLEITRKAAYMPKGKWM